MLLDAACTWAAMHGVTRLQLLADSTNALALAFYRKAGWTTTKMINLRMGISAQEVVHAH